MHPRRDSDEKGAILITAVWALLILSALAVSFAYRMSIEVKLAGLRHENLKAYCLAKAGIKTGIHELSSDDSRDHDSLKEGWFDNPEAFKHRRLEGGTFTVSSVGGTNPEVMRCYGLTDEEGKINISVAGEAVLERLFEAYPDVVPGILDWCDIDDVPRPGGAENAYYQTLPSPYRCRNGAFETLEELQLVRGVTPEIVSHVSGLVTTYGNGRVNINTCGERVLQCLGLPDDIVSALLVYRMGPDGSDGTADDNVFTTVEEIGATLLNAELGHAADLTHEGIGQIDVLARGGLLSVRSEYFWIHSVGITDTGEARQEITAVVRRQGEDLPQVVYWYEG